MLNRTLRAVAERFRAGETAADLEAWGAEQLTEAGFGQVDYVTVRDAASLEEVGVFDDNRTFRALGAARLGKARLIDNLAV